MSWVFTNKGFEHFVFAYVACKLQTLYGFKPTKTNGHIDRVSWCRLATDELLDRILTLIRPRIALRFINFCSGYLCFCCFVERAGVLALLLDENRIDNGVGRCQWQRRERPLPAFDVQDW